MIEKSQVRRCKTAGMLSCSSPNSIRTKSFFLKEIFFVMSQSSTENFNNALNTLVNARFQNWNSTEDMLNHFAWGFRNWLLGEIEMVTKIDEILSQLQKIEQRLDRIERSGKGFAR